MENSQVVETLGQIHIRWRLNWSSTGEFVARISHFGPTNRNRALQIARPKMY